MHELRRLDQAAIEGVVDKLAEAGVALAVEGPVVDDAGRAAAIGVVAAAEDLVAILDGVRRHIDLARDAATGKPGTIAVVALGRAAGPGLATVLRGEDAVVGEVDTGVVDRPEGVLRQVRVAESRVRQRLVAKLPGVAAIIRGPDPDVVLVAVGGGESRTQELLDRRRSPCPVDVR